MCCNVSESRAPARKRQDMWWWSSRECTIYECQQNGSWPPTYFPWWRLDWFPFTWESAITHLRDNLPDSPDLITGRAGYFQTVVRIRANWGADKSSLYTIKNRISYMEVMIGSRCLNILTRWPLEAADSRSSWCWERMNKGVHSL